MKKFQKPEIDKVFSKMKKIRLPFKIAGVLLIFATGLTILQPGIVQSLFNPQSLSSELARKEDRIRNLEEKLEGSKKQQTETDDEENTPETSSKIVPSNNIAIGSTGQSIQQDESEKPVAVQIEPTELRTCLWKAGPLVNHYCPYNPPVSWSGDYIKYPCYEFAAYGGTVPCPEYREFDAIVPQKYKEYEGLCQFTMGTSIKREVVVYKAVGAAAESLPDCMTGVPL